MVELRDDALVFSFPDVHRYATLTVEFQRTLRIPDDDREYALPPGLGRFPLRHVDDFADRVSPKWRERGGVMLPMYQSEAMWLNFTSSHDYPFAVKIATGKINAVTGDAWSEALTREPQDYLSIPSQPWLDGFYVAKGVVRQFVAMPLGSGYSVEEQITGDAEHGGVQILVYPLKREAYRPPRARLGRIDATVMYCLAEESPSYDMGLAPGGRMTQEIYDDVQSFSDWDLRHRGRCFVHLANSLVWRSITGQNPPTTPPTAAEYTRAGLPWFDYYDADRVALEGGDALKGIRSVVAIGNAKGDVPLPENESVDSQLVIGLKAERGKDEVRQGAF